MVDFKTFNMDSLGGVQSLTNPSPQVSARISRDVNPYDIKLLQRASKYYEALSDFRKRRKKARQFHRGEQLKDHIFDPDDNQWYTEEDYIRKRGKIPFKQNRVRQLIKNVIGQYLTDTGKITVVSRNREDATIGEMLTNTLQYALDRNQARRLDTRSLEEFLMSGACAQKTRYKYLPNLNEDDLFIENRNLARMFFNDNINDVRVEPDLNLIGEFYDLTIEKVISTFAGSDEDIARLRAIYASVLPASERLNEIGKNLSAEQYDSDSFYGTSSPNLARVFEIWERRIEKRLRCHDWLKGRTYIATMDQQVALDNANTVRIMEAARQGIPADKVPLIEYNATVEEFWYVKYLSPWGHVLMESETVYEHKSHPYTLLLYPLIDGEVWGFIEDIEDQQRLINRLLTLMDFIIGSSAKGVLLVPEEAIPDDMSIDDIAEEWTKFNGVIKLKLKHGVQLPKQIQSSASVAGVNEMLAVQLKFMEEISGVGPSIQGGRAPSGTPAKLYAQETANSSLNVRDYFETFNFFLHDRNWKALKTIIQFYDEERKLALSGSNYSEEAMVYDPTRARGAEFDLVITKSADSPVYRGVIEDALQQFVSNGLIDIEMYLRNSTLPFADKLLADIQSRRQQLEEAAGQGALGSSMPGAGQDIAGALQQQLVAQGGDASQANPQAAAMLQQYLAGQAA